MLEQTTDIQVELTPTNTTINTKVQDINYVPGYKEAETLRRTNEIVRINNEKDRISNEQQRIVNEQQRQKNEGVREQYISELQQKVDDGQFDGFSPTIEIAKNTNTEYILSITDKNGTITTPNFMPDDTLAYDDSEVRSLINQNVKSIENIQNNYSLSADVGALLDLNIDPSTYVMTIQLKNKDGTSLSTGTVDLPLETMVVGAEYDNENKEIVLILTSGSQTRFSVADLVDGLVSTTTLNTVKSDLEQKINNIFTEYEEMEEI